MMKRYLSRIARELRKLEATTADRPIARRNARKRALGAMRSLRKAVDEAYPAIVDRTGVKRRPPEIRIKALKKAGWREVDIHTAGRYAALGVTVKRVAWTTYEQRATGPRVYVKGVGWKEPKQETIADDHEALFVPDWAWAIGYDPAQLRAAKKSHARKNAAVVAYALTEPSE
jgi:hypothetical protein